MNKELLSYEELVEKLKGLEVLQSMHKKIYTTGGYDYKKRARHQSRAMELKKEINLVLSAINHAKEARKLYEYKRLHDSEKIRGLCTDNYLED